MHSPHSDLNHVGYSLDRSSVPLCDGFADEELQKCFMRHRKKFIWENRDFLVEKEAVLRYIEKFVLFKRDEARACDELKTNLDDRFVLYNIWCLKPKFWFPASDATKGCVHGTGYPIDHTNEKRAKEVYLFDTKDACCATYPAACQGKEAAEPHNSEPSSPGYALSLFHSYHEISQERMMEKMKFEMATVKKRNNRRGKRRMRKQQLER